MCRYQACINLCSTLQLDLKCSHQTPHLLLGIAQAAIEGLILRPKNDAGALGRGTADLGALARAEDLMNELLIISGKRGGASRLKLCSTVYHMTLSRWGGVSRLKLCSRSASIHTVPYMSGGGGASHSKCMQHSAYTYHKCQVGWSVAPAVAQHSTIHTDQLAWNVTLAVIQYSAYTYITSVLESL
eukprot:TRINITY_DN3310_c0_g1_i1.p1 TRINITY_DN3310_c0_g1~~TRINITY_DN3310_c0_g1_i1.p1  ORF type:complete len:186 (+),score=7.08 TRINITY_DN3310_c0_g1_i1:137-694(+)